MYRRQHNMKAKNDVKDGVKLKEYVICKHHIELSSSAHFLLSYLFIVYSLHHMLLPHCFIERHQGVWSVRLIAFLSPSCTNADADTTEICSISCCTRSDYGIISYLHAPPSLPFSASYSMTSLRVARSCSSKAALYLSSLLETDSRMMM